MRNIFRTIGFLFSVIIVIATIGTSHAVIITASTETGQTISLSPGWNTFSTPKVLENISFQSGGIGLYFYSLSSTGWQVVTPNIHTIKPLEGYMINNTSSGISNVALSYKTNLSPLDMIFQKTLQAGWNIVGITTISNPFSSIDSYVSMGLDFTRTSDGQTNNSNTVANPFYTTSGNANLGSYNLGESYGLFLQSPILLPATQPQAGSDGDTGDISFIKYSTGTKSVQYGLNDVKFFQGKIITSVPVYVTQMTVTPSITGSGIDSFQDSKFYVLIDDSIVGVIDNLDSPTTFILSDTTPIIFGTGNVTIQSSIKNDPSINGEYTFNLSIDGINDYRHKSISFGSGINMTGDKTIIKTVKAELKTATVAAPSTSRFYLSSEQEIGRFAITGNSEIARLQSIVLENSGTAYLQYIATAYNTARLIDVSTNAEVSSTSTISGNTITFSNMNDTIGINTTKNYKVVITPSNLEPFIGQTLHLDISASGISIVRDSNSLYIPTFGSATTRTYTIRTIAPTVSVTTINENSFKVRVTNPDTNTGITLTGLVLDMKTDLPGNTSYNATVCLRDLGNTNTCGGVGTSGSGAVPGLSIPLNVAGLTTNMNADKNGGYVEFEVYVTSPNLLPTGGQLQAAVTRLYYGVGNPATVADTETYVGTTGASATFTK